MLLQSELETGILAGPNLHPGTPGLTLSQSKVLETGSHYDMYRAAGGDLSWAWPAYNGKSTRDERNWVHGVWAAQELDETWNEMGTRRGKEGNQEAPVQGIEAETSDP